ncbi:beta-defensin 131A-like [Pteronotus mesoamericanus]|uniref:beta-defensin 131A-like n=1 Tax=Pteronotus mesoamericanus TaxID=1884717 RepID=UPI0023ED7D6E|nr:beta-defensin 131A-like [Pteronotus parnellii mesoamericanus]
MRVLLCILGILALFSTVPPARSMFFNDRCSSVDYQCRMKCNADEYAVRYCADWSICCRVKQIEVKKRRKW